MTTGIPRHQRAEEPQDRRGLIGCGHRPLCLLAQLDCLGDQLDVGRFAAAAVERKSEVNMPAAVKREPSDFGFDDVTADGRHGPTAGHKAQDYKARVEGRCRRWEPQTGRRVSDHVSAYSRTYSHDVSKLIRMCSDSRP